MSQSKRPTAGDCALPQAKRPCTQVDVGTLIGLHLDSLGKALKEQNWPEVQRLGTEVLSLLPRNSTCVRSKELVSQLHLVLASALRDLGRVDEAVTCLEDGLEDLLRDGAAHPQAPATVVEELLRSELANRRLLSMLYELEASSSSAASAQLVSPASPTLHDTTTTVAATTDAAIHSQMDTPASSPYCHCQRASAAGDCATSCTTTCSTSAASPSSCSTCKATENCMRTVALAARLQDYDALVDVSMALVGMCAARQQHETANTALRSCITQCSAVVADPVRRAGLLRRLLPLQMELLNSQGKVAEGFACWRQLQGVLEQLGRRVADDCPICTDDLCIERACVALCCGHSFHRACFDEWLGHKMFLAGEFVPECPVCKQIDRSLRPTAAAIQALDEFRQGSSTDTDADSGTDDEVEAEGEVGAEAESQQEMEGPSGPEGSQQQQQGQQ